MKCLGVERKQDRKKTSDLNSKDKNHINVCCCFFNVYNNFTFNGVRVSLWCFYFLESYFLLFLQFLQNTHIQCVSCAGYVSCTVEQM